MQKMYSKVLSILLTVCMVVTMLPTVAFAEEGVQDSGTSPGTSEITAFADLAEDVALQEVETGTTVDELNLPSALTVTVTTGSAMTATVSGESDVATDSDAQKTETQEETTVVVSEWTADPAYDGDTVTVGDYVYTPTLDLPDDTTLAEGVTLPQIKVTVKAAAAPMLLGAEIQPLGTGTGTDITAKFTDAKFLAEVRTALHKGGSVSIYDTDNFASVTRLDMSNKGIKSLAGIEYFTVLTTLYCCMNNLTSLDVSKNTALTTLECDDNQLTTLDVSNNNALENLLCGNNKLTTLDVRINTKLTALGCHNNQLTELDVRNNTALNTLDCHGNYMANKSVITGLDTSRTTKFTFDPQKSSTSTYSITVNSGTASPSTAAEGATVTITANTPPDSGKRFKEWTVVSGGITLNSTTSATTTFTMPTNAVVVTATYESISASGTDITAKFTDANFLAAVRTALKKYGTIPICDTDNFASVTSLNMSNKGIKSLEGIEYFTALTYLACDGNQLTALDVSKNTKLTYLYCDSNRLTALDVSKNTALIELHCYDNQLSILNVSNNTALTRLNCNGNQLITLDMSKNTVLTELWCNENQLTALNVSKNTKLAALRCQNNQLPALDVSKNTVLTELRCNENRLTTLDLSNNTALNRLYCSNNYMAAKSAVTGLDKNLMVDFFFDPQNTSTSTYSITVNSGTAKPSTAVAGATVTITANAPGSGKQFKEWTVVSGGVTLDSTTSATTNFTMPANAVEVTASYENISASGTDITNKFTDANFLAAVYAAIGKTAPEAIYDTDVSGVASLDVIGKSISSLEGIEYFTALTTLDCSTNQLTALDVSKNTKLTELRCKENKLTALDVSKNTKLTELYCNCNQLTTLDVSNNTALTTLNCSSNYMANESAVNGLDTSRTTFFIFDPQKSSASTYAVTVNSGTASQSPAAKGATVSITASTPQNGKRFKVWTVVSGGVTLANAQAASTTFTMPANAVVVTATYEDILAGVTSVTGVTLNKNKLSLYSNTTPNTATLIATVAPSSATDKSVTWQSSNTAVATVDASGNVKAAGNGTATITVTTTDGGYTASCIVTVSTYSSGGGSSSGGSSGGGSSSSGSSVATTTTTTEKKPNQSVTAAAHITATAGTNGAASASIPDKSISDAIIKAQADAKAQGKTTNSVSVALNVTMPEGATALTATLTRSSLDSLVSAGVTNLEINGSPVSVTFDQKALTEIQKKSSGNINIAIAPKTNLSETAKKMIGSRPVYNITVGYGNSSTVSSFGDGVATVAIPYTPANGEAIGGVYAVYVDEKGNATRIAGSAYNANSGCVIFTTPHFSMYGVGYTAPSANFTDINSHWAKESINYVVGRGLLSGTTETTFAPDTAMTRGMLVTALGRLAGVDTKAYTTSSFTDVNADSTYRPYIEWAYKKGIIQGIGSNQFAPDRAITREEIAVIIANFAKATGYTLPLTREATTYADVSSIGSTYKTAVTAMQEAGIMMGGTSNKFNPKSNATRAEVSSMLGRYIKLTIDSDTARGWTLNDAGHYL